MKTIFTTFLLGLTALLASGQSTEYPQGGYLSFDAVVSKTPDITVELEVQRRTESDIKMNGGNDFKLFKADKSIPKKVIKKKYYAYSDGDSLYLNCYHYDIQFWYTPVLSDGKFWVIRGGLSMNPEIQQEQLENYVNLGYMFGPVVGGMQGAKLALLRFIYIIDKESNQLTLVSGDVLRQLLRGTPELLAQYEAEEVKLDQETFVKYLSLINERNSP